MTDAGSQYLNQPPRELSDVIHMREWGDPTDLGIPSDSPYEGTSWTPWTDARPIYQYSDPRYDGHTLHDIVAEEDGDFWNDPKDKIQWGIVLTWLSIIAICALFWGFVIIEGWAFLHPITQ